jgi:hypothetical protein
LGKKYQTNQIVKKNLFIGISLDYRGTDIAEIILKSIGRINMCYRKSAFIIILFFILLVSCAGTPLRPALKENITVPPGKIEGNRFKGIRYPFNVSIPSLWKMTMEFPDFLVELGYDKPSPTDKEQTELYAYNPETKSTIQFDLTPAGQYSKFTQDLIDKLTTMAVGSLKDEIEKDYGMGINVEVSSTELATLKGVQFAAKKYAIYVARGKKLEQGWVYGFAEPYQIFILYTILGEDATIERQDIKKILDSFEVVSEK